MAPGTTSIGGDTVYQQLVTGQSSVTGAVTTIVSAESNRGKIQLVNISTDVDVYYSSDTAVGTTSGHYLPASGASGWIPFNGALYGITSSGTADVSYASLEGA